ncbi:DUF7511 domain-containing protein [Natronorarus salvus]|uniref:DUF7511 domain-containing protein n=1 Tax=Natronorarus salvus TaxID=3117733 RepID=UPI002F26BF21
MDRPSEDTIRRSDLPVVADPLDLLVHEGDWTLVPREVDDERRTTVWLTADERTVCELAEWR